MSSPVPLYDTLAAGYDRFVNWGGRLAHELPFFEQLFEGQGVRRVLDAACGTGHHALALARRGYRLVGADLSAPMIEAAGQNAVRAGVGVPFVVAGLGEHASLGETFDAVLCLGNSLPHLLTGPAVAGALADFAAILRPGGLLVIQNRNFDKVWAERQRFMEPQSHREGEQEWLFFRFYDFHEKTITFNMVLLQRRAGSWTSEVEATELRPVFGHDLAAMLTASGFDEIRLYGGYDRSLFDPARSGDLIAVARRVG